MNKVLKILNVSFLTIFLSYCTSVEKVESKSELEKQIKLPEGFKIDIFAEVAGARSMTLSSKGTLFIASISQGKIFAIPNADKEIKAKKILTILKDLYNPNGVAVKDDNLYVGEISKISMYKNIESNLEKTPEPITITDKLPKETHHGYKFIKFGPDGLLYVPIGAPCNICKKENKVYATITRMKPDGSKFEIFAEGIRNTVGFDWSPDKKELWFTDNGRDMLGDDMPNDELNHAPKKGLNFGYPYCHSGYIEDPEFGSKDICKSFTPPAMKLGPHVASLGMRFYTGKMFPSEYKQNIFIAEHGSWNRSKPIGYRVSWVKVENNKALSYQTFAEGWLSKDGKVLGRPVDIQVMPDGAILVSDDYSGRIYRISYNKKG
jgi:glucose/arabinose dehydrogenase